MGEDQVLDTQEALFHHVEEFSISCQTTFHYSHGTLQLGLPHTISHAFTMSAPHAEFQDQADPGVETPQTGDTMQDDYKSRPGQN